MASQRASVVLVHDYLLVLRGAERTFAAMAACWPGAPISTLLYQPEVMAERFAGHPVRASYLQRLGVRQEGFRRLLPLMPRAAQRLPVAGHELVVSSSSAFAHGVRPSPGAVHVCYCHSPFRYAWHESERALHELPRVARPVLRRGLTRIRAWDLEASTRVTHYVANSETTRRRIHDFWGREATVLHPPVEVHRFRAAPAAPEDYFLVVGELVRHKRTEAALEAARRVGKPIKVVGTGPDRERLEAIYGKTAEFLGRVNDDRLERLYSQTRALIVPNVEEFGIAAVEAQAAGRPVVALDAGGAQETVIDGSTGVLVPPDDPDALAEALAHTDFDRFSAERIRAHAAGFAVEAFQQRLLEEVGRARAS